MRQRRADFGARRHDHLVISSIPAANHLRIDLRIRRSPRYRATLLREAGGTGSMHSISTFRRLATLKRHAGSRLPRIAALIGDAPTGKQKVSTQDRARTDRQPVVWFEVEDFLRYFDHFQNPTGLQRTAFEIYREAERLNGETCKVRFCRLSVYSKQFMVSGFDAVRDAYTHPPGIDAPWQAIGAPARFWRDSFRMLPLIARNRRFFLRIFLDFVRDLVAGRHRKHRFERDVQPGDFVVSLGASWGYPHYLKHIAKAKTRYGVKFAILVHDLIPIQNQRFFDLWYVDQFRTWLSEALRHADMVLTISNYSRSALVKLVAETEGRMPCIEVLKLGATMSTKSAAKDQTEMKLPPRFALFVSTIEVRKNHRLLVRVWERLIQRYGEDAVPVLMFVGQIGWLVDDLLSELAESNYLNGKIQLMSKLSDNDLSRAYRACQFTIFPSLCEGWGLPIAESLAHGKFCVASSRASIPEVGGDLVDYFDPSNEDDALAKIERLLLDPGYLAAREARLRAEYVAPTWANCVHSLIGKLTQFRAQQGESPE
jgi:glycosyltransferase involved in cell wall biosynthesis